MKLFFIALFLIPLSLKAQCNRDVEISLVYINGVNNTEAEAIASRDEIEKLIHEDVTLSNLDICIDYIYNPTQGAFDLIEVLDQKIHENIPLVLLRKYFPGVSSQLDSINNLLTGNISKKFLREKVFPKIEKIIGNGPMILISHSQGNLIANEVSTYLINKEVFDFSNLQVASTIYEIKAPKSDYITISQDRVIALLGPSALKSNVTTINALEYDSLGHNFINVYLNSNIINTNEENLAQIFMFKLKFQMNKLLNGLIWANQHKPDDLDTHDLE
jgi:ribosomal protein S13